MKKLTTIILFFSLNVFSQPNESRINRLRSETIIDNQDKAVFDLLDEFYTQGLQSELGELNPNTQKKIDKLYKNKNTKNRHLLLMFIAYQDHITQTLAVGKRPNPKFQVELMTDLAYEFQNIFNKIPAIIYIYKFEALDTSGQNEEAAKIIDEGLSDYSDSVPLKIYKFLSSKDETIKTDLVNNHSNHWMVKQFEIK
ncbi:hypothetical protein [Flavobacterium sp. LAR06]|uniref:hypothetical protein n=1 Tax=Flavobacterium sp. LAR06 TaxID=3064897 RepID=UPI0035BFF8FA